MNLRGKFIRLKKIVDAADAVAVIHDGDVVASVGYGGNGTPDQLFVALEKRFVYFGLSPTLEKLIVDSRIQA